jgi:hypothetical protein
MLSFIYSMASEFEQEYGFSPNLMYMNYTHLECLKQQLSDPGDLESIVQLLGMEIILHQDVTYPQVAWANIPWKFAMNS